MWTPSRSQAVTLRHAEDCLEVWIRFRTFNCEIVESAIVKVEGIGLEHGVVGECLENIMRYPRGTKNKNFTIRSGFSSFRFR